MISIESLAEHQLINLPVKIWACTFFVYTKNVCCPSLKWEIMNNAGKAMKSWLTILCKCTDPQNMDTFGWFNNILVYLFNLFQNFPSSNFRHWNIVSLSKIRMSPTNLFCQCVKLNLHWTNWDSASSFFFKKLNIVEWHVCVVVSCRYNFSIKS